MFFLQCTTTKTTLEDFFVALPTYILMYICVCVYIYIYVCVCVCVCVCAFHPLCTQIYPHLHPYTPMQTAQVWAYDPHSGAGFHYYTLCFQSADGLVRKMHGPNAKGVPIDLLLYPEKQ